MPQPLYRWGRWGVRARILAWKNVLAFHLKGRRRNCQQGKKLAIFKPDRLGDFTLSLGAIRWLLRREGDENCVLFISPHAAELAQREFPKVTKVIVQAFADELWPAWRRFKDQVPQVWWDHKFDVAVSLRHQRTSWQELLFGRLRCRENWAQSNQVLGRHPIEQRWITARLAGKVFTAKDSGRFSCLELEAHRQLLERAFATQVKPEDVLPTLETPAGVRSNGALLLCPFGSSALRTLPVEVVVSGIKEFQRIQPLPLRLAAAPAEIGRYEAYADELAARGLPRPTVVQTPTLGALLEELAASRLVLTTESAPAHLAVALDRPTVVLLGGGHHGLFAPWSRSSRQIWLDHRTDCYHCDWQCSQTEPICLTRIAPTAVSQALLKVLSEP